jgi:hypothetical protein
MATFTASAAASNAPAIYAVNGNVTRVVQRTVAVALSAGDVYQMMKIPAGAVVTDLTFVADLFGGGNATVTIGDGNDADRYIASLSAGASGTTRMSLPAGFGYSYSAEDTIDITFSTVTSASAVGSVKLIVTYTNQNGD